MVARKSRIGVAVALALWAGSALAADGVLPQSKSDTGNRNGLMQACPEYGFGFFRVPGSKTCIKIGIDNTFEVLGDFVRKDFVITTLRWPTIATPTGGVPDLNYAVRDLRNSANRLTYRNDLQVQLSSVTPTDYGPLLTHMVFRTLPLLAAADARFSTVTQTQTLLVDQAWIAFAGFTAGLRKSFFDFTQPGYVWRGGYGSNRNVQMLAYTKSLGIVSGTLSLEDGSARRYADGVIARYAGMRTPDVVGQIRVTPTWGTLHLSGVWHQIRDASAFNCCATRYGTANGWAVNAGAEYRVKWSDVFGPSIGDMYGRFIVTGTIGQGAQSYLGIPFFAPDYVADENGAVRMTRGKTWLASYEHIWRPNLKSTFAISRYYTRTVSGIANGCINQVACGAIIPFNFDFRSSGTLYQVGTEYMPVSNLMLGAKLEYYRDRMKGFNLGVPQANSKVDFFNASIYVRRVI